MINRGLLHPIGSTDQAGQMTTDANGNYTSSFVLPGAADTGSWSLGVAAGTANGAASFTVTTPPLMPGAGNQHDIYLDPAAVLNAGPFRAGRRRGFGRQWGQG